MLGEVLQEGNIQIGRRWCITRFQIQERIDSGPGIKEFGENSVVVPAGMRITRAVFSRC